MTKVFHRTVRYYSPYILTESGLELGKTPTISRTLSTNKTIYWNHTLAKPPTQVLKLLLGFLFSPRWLVSQPVWEMLDLNHLSVKKNEIHPIKAASKSSSIQVSLRFLFGARNCTPVSSVQSHNLCMNTGKRNWTIHTLIYSGITVWLASMTFCSTFLSFPPQKCDMCWPSSWYQIRKLGIYCFSDFCLQHSYLLCYFEWILGGRELFLLAFSNCWLLHFKLAIPLSVWQPVH